MNNIRTIAAAALIAAVVTTGCNVFRGQSTPGQYVDDVAITAKVKSELLESKKVDGLDVNVDSTNGRVKLTGWGSSAAEIRSAGAMARNVEGVKSVDNQLKVKDKQ
jgi:hyperosmotically inducible periplasmic protein